LLDAHRLTDGTRLLLHSSPRGTSLWRFRFTLHAVEGMCDLGIYPDVPLIEARKRIDAARRLVAKGVDSAEQRRQERAAQGATLKGLAADLFDAQAQRLRGSTLERDRQCLAPSQQALGARPIATITAAEMHNAIKLMNQHPEVSTGKAGVRPDRTHEPRARCLGGPSRPATSPGRGESSRDPEPRGYRLAPACRVRYQGGLVTRSAARPGVHLRAPGRMAQHDMGRA
jgi:hypothetical protein